MQQEKGQSKARGSPSHQLGKTTWRQALTAFNIGWDLAFPIFGGVLLGHYLDRRSGGGHTFTIGLLVLGLVVGVYNVVCTLQRELRRDPFRARHRVSERDDAQGR